MDPELAISPYRPDQPLQGPSVDFRKSLGEFHPLASALCAQIVDWISDIKNKPPEELIVGYGGQALVTRPPCLDGTGLVLKTSGGILKIIVPYPISNEDGVYNPTVAYLREAGIVEIPYSHEFVVPTPHEENPDRKATFILAMDLTENGKYTVTEDKKVIDGLANANALQARLAKIDAVLDSIRRGEHSAFRFASDTSIADSFVRFDPETRIGQIVFGDFGHSSIVRRVLGSADASPSGFLDLHGPQLGRRNAE